MRARNSYLLAVLSGILLLLSLPPFKFGGFLAWFALVPILIAVFYETRAKRIMKLAWIFSLGAVPINLWFAWWFPEMSSLAHLEHLFWLWFALGLAFAVAVAIGFYGERIGGYWKPKCFHSKSISYLPSGLQMVSLPLILTGLEFLWMNVPGVMQFGGTFGLWSVAKTQWLNPPILKLASLTGMYGVTFLILLVNCAIAYGILHYRETKQVFKMAVGVLVIFAIIFSYGAVTVPQEEDGDVTVAIIQIPEETGNLQQQFLELSEVALKYNPEFIIWSAFVFKDLTVEPYVDFAQANDVYLAGWGEEKTNAIVSPTGEIAYHNMHYNFFTIPQRIGQGDIKSIFFPDIHGIHTEFGSVGILECAEAGSTLPAKDFANKGVQFLLVTTSSPSTYVYSWALGTSAIYRAVEHRMFAVEVIGDHDSSIIIDPYGRIVEDIAPEEEIVAGRVSFVSERTFYSKYGDIFGWTISGLFIILIGYNLYLKRKSPYAFCGKCRTQMEKGTKVCPSCGKKRK